MSTGAQETFGWHEPNPPETYRQRKQRTRGPAYLLYRPGYNGETLYIAKAHDLVRTGPMRLETTPGVYRNFHGVRAHLSRWTTNPAKAHRFKDRRAAVRHKGEQERICESRAVFYAHIAREAPDKQHVSQYEIDRADAYASARLIRVD